nr:MAG TPA: hypothetical protein [Caudoviricetes sp.]
MEKSGAWGLNWESNKILPHTPYYSIKICLIYQEKYYLCNQ